MPAPDSIRDLVQRFQSQFASYHHPGYNETALRRDFLDPFFAALGWDMTNTGGGSEKYREVIHEVSVEVEGAAKAADYAFRMGGNNVFFVEAKKPAVNIADSAAAAFQLRSYGWSGKLALSLLTDFEQLAVYDCRSKPKPGEAAHVGRVNLYRYSEYVDKWDEIYSRFSREAVFKGSFDEFAAGTKGKKGTTDVDDAFLEMLEGWRELLARNIALRNPGLSVHDLNFAVQTTIDRIIFLRICEDRGIEADDALRSATDGKDIYQDLLVLFRSADKKYNSGLFHFSDEKQQTSQADTLTPALKIDDKVLKEILAGLYHPSPYAFKYIPADILGQVYERFLGKVIRLTNAHQAKVEEKPEVRKAGGVYYTPTYIVEYIVKNTLGELLSGQTPETQAARPLRVLDPACGSGSFLLGAYQYLLDWYLEWYAQNEPARHARGKSPAVVEAQGGWQLTMEKKKDILLAHIFGVDIDAQAVEVTKLSLLLKVVENPGQLSLLDERILPDLGANIQCGNSLIGRDYYHGRQMPMFGDEELYRVNPFDWQDAFKAVFAQGGFDAVIGNPPYGAQFTKDDSNYLQRKYQTFVWRGESYLAFIEKAHNCLRSEGRFGFIVPDTYLNLGFTKVLRKYLLQYSLIKEIVVLPKSVFSSATVDTTLLFTEKPMEGKELQTSSVVVKIFDKKGTIQNLDEPVNTILIDSASWNIENGFIINSNIKDFSVISKIESNNQILGKYCEIFYGIKTYQVGKGKPPQTAKIRDSKPFTSDVQKTSEFLPFFDGKHIDRYRLTWNNNNWINYGPWLAEPRFPEKFLGEKLLIRKIISKTLIATYVKEESYCNTLLYVLKLFNVNEFSYQYLLGVLNSRLIGWYFRKKFQISAEDTFPQILIRDILKFPISKPNRVSHERMVALVESMLGLHKQLGAARSPQEKELLQRQIAFTDREIDALVYELYGLTDEEIKIVEGTG